LANHPTGDPPHTRTLQVVTRRFVPSAGLVQRLALASLLANIGIVLSGGAVRLTGSGLGCPTWPRCTDASWTATPEMGLHGVVEFGNRTLTAVLGVIAVAGLVAVLAQRPRRRSLVWLALGVLAGIAGQGLVGGVTVWTGLNPWIVGGHFLISMAIIAVAHTFWRRAAEPDVPALATVPAPLRALVWVIVATGAMLLAVGTVVTGSGPHAGDAEVARNGLDPQAISQVHADLSFLLLGLAVAAWFALRAVDAGPRSASGGPRPVRAAGALVAVILGQGAVGLVQYTTGLPEVLVGLHLLGACLVWLAILHLQHSTRVRAAAGPAATRQQPALASAPPG
jgi:cytochrome c oxidase assembly protein subunit 15